MTRAVLQAKSSSLGVDLSSGEQSVVSAYCDAVVADLESSPGISYGFISDTEIEVASVYATSSVLFNLVDMGLMGSDMVGTLSTWLVDQQEDGWWYNEELTGLDLPTWHDPGKVSTRIFNTALAAAALAVVDTGRSMSACTDAVDQLEQMMTDAGALLGLSQSSWVVTPAIAYVYGLDSKQFVRHWTLLDQYVDDTSLANTISITRQLIRSGVNPDDRLVQRCLSLLPGTVEDYQRLSPASALAALLIRSYTRSSA